MASQRFFSAPVWWCFEVVNWRTQNWIYLSREQFSDLTYFLLASVAFSTVIPAVFETAEWVRTFGWMRRLKDGPRLRATRSFCAAVVVIGVAMLALLLVWPTYFYPFIWGWLFFVLEPLNVWLGNRSLFDATGRGDWRPVVSLALGALVCGFVWELWNCYAYPK
ncbi:MAG: hypothetical protein BRD45_05805 [Bacteroidetes bacterium QS_8_64_10]|nr:MAG: hypothetical protein BRD45_05805 [Bacteroidetes bacterium QS_8_64_10]